MGRITDSASAEIDAPLNVVWKAVEDVERAPEWQGGMISMEALERDREGRGTLCETKADLKVTQAKTQVEFDYSGAPNTLRWQQVKGDVKSLDGAWILEDLGDGRTKATFELDVDTGRMLGLLIRGPVEGQVKKILVGNRPEELKGFVEG
jgi:ribosome-associated toxin RatA of RatAB toxin-antitoxin module